MDQTALELFLDELLGRCRDACQVADLAASTLSGPSPSSQVCSAQLNEVAGLIKGVEDRVARDFLSVSPESPVLGSADCRTRVSASEVDHLIHDLRGIRTVFSLGAELNLAPAEMAPLVQGASQMARRLDPILREFEELLKSRGRGS